MESGYDYLEASLNHEQRLSCATAQDFSLEILKKVLSRLGDPQKNINFVHVAGSKGKGSVCAMTAEALRRAGYRVGLYTSPHLYDVTERIRILDFHGGNEQAFDGCISQDELEECLLNVKSAAAKEGQLTYFEILTAAAFLYFDKKEIDIGVLETGLGGRLDATNAVNALVSAITRIDLEHINILGSSLESIAEEKAGIIKQGCRHVVLGYQGNKSIDDVLIARCAQFGIAPVRIDGDGFDEDGQNRIQAENRAVCSRVCQALRQEGFSLEDNLVGKAMEHTFWPGRLEVFEGEPIIVLDGAHTPLAAQALMSFAKRFLGDKKKVLVFGISRDKNKQALSGVLNNCVNEVVLTRSEHDRAYQWQDKDKEFFKHTHVDMIKNSRDALVLAKQKAGADGAVIITGSLFLVAQLRKVLCEELAV